LINLYNFGILYKYNYIKAMYKGFKYRIYPTKAQSTLLNKHLGCTRLVYNLALELKTMAWAGHRTNLSRYDISKQLPELKNEYPWLKEVNSQSLQSALVDLDTAYDKFFKGQADFPNFKRKAHGGSFHIPQNITLEGRKLSIPKFREGIDIVLHRETKGIIKSATISKTPTGKYFVSILCDTGQQPKPKPDIKPETTVGIDLGLKDFAITSDGLKVSSPKYLREAECKLKYLQRKYSKYKGKRTREKLALQHEKVANKRKDFLHKLSTRLIRENQTIALEDLNVKGMQQNHCLAKSISDAGWGMFVDMLKYKAEWYGVNLLKIGRFDPSSKTCSNCGQIHEELTLSDRKWECKACNKTHDRDVNAAKNVKAFALNNYNVSAGRRNKSQDELSALVEVMTPEAHPIGSAVGE